MGERKMWVFEVMFCLAVLRSSFLEIKYLIAMFAQLASLL
jgi:hypothetical protein